jgi:hypothetical protein
MSECLTLPEFAWKSVLTITYRKFCANRAVDAQNDKKIANLCIHQHKLKQSGKIGT